MISPPSYAHYSSTYLYAHDTALIVRGAHVKLMSDHLNNELENVEKWFTANKLSINKSKTKCTLFSSKRYPEKDQPLNLDSDIEQVHEFKYLGVHLDRHLTFNNHCAVLGKKV